MRTLTQTTQALADESRLRILGLLATESVAAGELCVCQIIDVLGLAPSTISKHLALLRQADLIEGRKEGRWMHYRLAPPPGGPPPWILKRLATEARVAEDRASLLRLLRFDLEEVTRRQRAGERCCAPTKG